VKLRVLIYNKRNKLGAVNVVVGGVVTVTKKE
jgi:hypothetical protein